MTTRGKTPKLKTAAKKPTGITKAKIERVARKTSESLDTATHDAGLALCRGARKLQAKFEEAKGPAKRRARRVERKVGSVLESVGELVTAVMRKAKSRLSATRRKSIGKRRIQSKGAA